MALSAGVSEDVHEAVVIGDHNEGLVVRETHTVHMGAISSSREDAVDEPAELR